MHAQRDGPATKKRLQESLKVKNDECSACVYSSPISSRRGYRHLYCFDLAELRSNTIRPSSYLMSSLCLIAISLHAS